MAKIFGIFVLIILFSACSTAELSCEQIETEMKNSLNEANYCEIDSDCTILELSFEYNKIGCFHLGNKKIKLHPFEKLGNKYRENDCLIKISEFCTYPSLEEIKCVEGKCVDTRFQN